MIVLSSNITTVLSAAIKDLDSDALIGIVREGIYDALSEALSDEEPDEAKVETIVNEVCNQVGTLLKKRHKDIDTSDLIGTLRKRVMGIMGSEDCEDDEKWLGLQEIFEDIFAKLSLRGELLGLSEKEDRPSQRRGKTRHSDTIEKDSAPICASTQKKTQESSSGSFTDDPMLKRFLTDVAKTPLLTREEEVELALRINKGDEKARAHMIKANLRLVIHIANDYKNYGLSLLDLIQEGSMGLTKAVDRYDPSYGSKLSTYAAWWIKQAIRRALAYQSRTIRLPVHMGDKIRKMNRVSMKLSEELGREPTDEELAEEIGVPRVKIVNMKTAALSPRSLDAPVGDEPDSATFGEFVADESARSPFEITVENNMHGQVQNFLATLDERGRKIIEARFGLAGEKEKTLKEVGKTFGVTRERIRQLEKDALISMRSKSNQNENPFREKKGNDFMGDSLLRTRALEQLAQMQQRMDEKALSAILEKRTNHHPHTPPLYSSLTAMQQKKGMSEEEKQRRREEKRIKREQARELKIQTKRKKKAQKAPPFIAIEQLPDIERQIIERYYGWDGTEFHLENDCSFKDIASELNISARSVYQYFLQGHRTLCLAEYPEDRERNKGQQIEGKITAKEAKKMASVTKYFHAKREEAKTIRLFLEHFTDREQEIISMFWGVSDEDVTCTIKHIAETGGIQYYIINSCISNIRKKIQKWSVTPPITGDLITGFDVPKEEFRRSPDPAKISKAKSNQSDFSQQKRTQINSLQPSRILPNKQDPLIIALYDPTNIPKLAEDLDMTEEELLARGQMLGMDILCAHISTLKSGKGAWLTNKDFGHIYDISIEWLQGGKKASHLVHEEARTIGVEGSKHFDVLIRDTKYFSPHLQALLLKAYKKQYPSYRIPQDILK